MAYYL